jgi:hypothetical protein
MGAIIHHLLDRAPAPVAPFSHAVETDGWIFPDTPHRAGLLRLHRKRP